MSHREQYVAFFFFWVLRVVIIGGGSHYFFQFMRRVNDHFMKIGGGPPSFQKFWTKFCQPTPPGYKRTVPKFSRWSRIWEYQRFSVNDRQMIVFHNPFRAKRIFNCFFVWILQLKYNLRFLNGSQVWIPVALSEPMCEGHLLSAIYCHRLYIWEKLHPEIVFQFLTFGPSLKSGKGAVQHFIPFVCRKGPFKNCLNTLNTTPQT